MGMDQMKAYIVGAGKHYGEVFSPQKEDLVIAADGGFDYLQKMNIRCDIVIGDFDSVKDYPEHNNVIKLNPIKDETDMLSAINIAIEKGYKRFDIYGGLGGRISHSMANIQLLSNLAKRGYVGYLYGQNEEITVIKDSYITFDKDMRGYISVFSLVEESFGVYETNLKYTLDNYTMKNDYAIGVSNEFIGKEARIEVKDGILLIIVEKNKV